MKKAFIFAAGVYGNEFPIISEGDMIIAADGGYEVLKKHSVTPDITVGDFDSSSEKPEKNVISLPVEKDVTDTKAAVDIALTSGCDEIYIYGGTGGRPDHEYANYSLIAELSMRGIKAFLVGEKYIVTAVTDGKICIYGKIGATASVFSWSDSSFGVTLSGLKYHLSDAVLKNSFALGVSNSFAEEAAEISVERGTLLIMHEYCV